jgi:hypothetical protein
MNSILVTLRRLTFSAAGVALLAASSIVCAAGPVYKSVGPDGTVIYSDIPPASGSTQIKKAEVPAKPLSHENDPLGAAMIVVGQEAVVESAYRLCWKEDPESARAVAQARNEWMEKHAELRLKKIVVLHDILSRGELEKLAISLEQENEAVLDKIRQAPQAQRYKWCRDAPTKFSAPAMNLLARPALVQTILGYKKKTR